MANCNLFSEYTVYTVEYTNITNHISLQP